MPAAAPSGPLAQLVHEARTAVGECLVGGQTPQRASAEDAIDHVAAGFLAAMGMGEIADDLDVRGIAVLSVAAMAGLQEIGLREPAVARLDSALAALEDLLRRTGTAQKGDA